MENKKLDELLQNKSFMEKIFQATTETEAQKLFSDNGVNLSSQDMKVLASIILEAAKHEGELTQSDLDEIAGGNANDIAVGILGGAGVTSLAALALAVWSFKKGYEYANSWWERTTTYRVESKTVTNNNNAPKA